jgi:hypothetical protein
MALFERISAEIGDEILSPTRSLPLAQAVENIASGSLETKN